MSVNLSWLCCYKSVFIILVFCLKDAFSAIEKYISPKRTEVLYFMFAAERKVYLSVLLMFRNVSWLTCIEIISVYFVVLMGNDSTSIINWMFYWDTALHILHRRLLRRGGCTGPWRELLYHNHYKSYCVLPISQVRPSLGTYFKCEDVITKSFIERPE
jgi:hypothetical protein